MNDIDRSAALANIAARPDDYPLIRHLPDDLRALLEPAERMHRYADLAVALLEDASRIIRGMHDSLTVVVTRIELTLVLNALYDSIKALERQRAEAEGAAETLRRQREAWVEDDKARMEKSDALTGDRTIAEVLESERTLRLALADTRRELDALKCERTGRTV